MAREEDAGATVDALEQLYRSRYRRFLRVALAIVGSREAAADVVQDAFARALRARGSFRGDGSLEAWVWRMVVNGARTSAQRTRVHATLDAVEARTNGSPAELRELRAAVAALPERQRHVLFLRHYAGLSYDEIADVLEIARGTVSATLHTAHASLRRSLGGVPS